MPFFSNLFKRDASSKARKQVAADRTVAPAKPRWEEAWSRKEVSPEEVQELIHECSQEMKSRGEGPALYHLRVAANFPSQPSICPSSCSHFDQAQIPLGPRASYAISSRYNMRAHSKRTSKISSKSFGSWIHWYVHQSSANRTTQLTKVHRSFAVL
jgi:hypothetical protein